MENKSPDGNKYENIRQERYICEKTVWEGIEDSKNSAIKHIMRVVDNNITDFRSHKNIRAVILDEINDMAREFADILERAYGE